MMAGNLNELGGVWLPWVLDRGIAAGLVFLCVAAVAVLLRRRASAHLLSWMWLIPLVPLVIPVDRWMPGLEAPVAPRAVIEAVVGLADGAAPSTSADAVSSPDAAHVATVAPAPGGDREAALPHDGTSVAPSAWLLIAWAAVVVILGVRFAWNQARWQRVIRQHEADGGALRRRVVRLARRAGVRGDVRAAVTDRLASPATSGWMRPTILVPRDLVVRLSPPQLDWVLLHELAHVRRCDLVVAAVQRLIQIVWWWHPVAWIANAEVARHREYACDDAASACMTRSNRRPGAKALFEVVATASGVPARTPALAMLVDHKSHLRRRLMRLLDGRRPIGRGTSFLGALGLVASAVAAFTVANAQKPAELARVAAETVVQETVPTEAKARAREAMRRAVRWLVRHQQEDGRWKVGPEGRTAAGMESEVSSTARAVMALAEADAMVGSKASRAARAKAVAWLESVQDGEGCIGPRKGSAFMYGHALAVIALCAEQDRARDDRRMKVIEKAARFTLKAQNPYRGWRYGVRDGDNDSSMTCLMLMGLRASAKLGVKVGRQPFLMAESYLDSMVDDETGRVGWVKRGGGVGRLAETWKTHPPEHSEEVTALALVAWLEVGRDPAKEPVLRKGISLVFDKLPEWTARNGTIDYRYWYWGTRLFDRLGGWQRKAWTEAYLDEVLPRTRWLPDGTATWPLDGAWCVPGLETYVTATQIRTLAHVLGK